MAYTRLGLKDGDKVKAEHVTHVEDGIDELNTDLAVRTMTNLSALGLSNGVSSLDVLQAMRNQGYTNTLMYLTVTNDSTISDTPTGSGVFRFYVGSSASQRYGFLEYMCNSGSTTPRYFIGHITSSFAGVNWFEVGLTQINSLSLPLPEAEPED